MLKISSTVLVYGKAWTNFSTGDSSERSSQTGSCLQLSALLSASYSIFYFYFTFLLRISMFFSALLIYWFFQRLNLLHSMISCLSCLMINTSSTLPSFCLYFFYLCSWQLRQSIMACFLAQPLSYFGWFSLSLFSFWMFCYWIFFWIYFSFMMRYFFCYMYLKSLRFQGIFIYYYSAFTDGAAETGFFFAFCCYSKIRLFFYFRSYSFCLAYSYSFLRAYYSFFAFYSFFFCIYRLLSSISFNLRAISDSDSFSRLLSSSAFPFQSCLAGTAFVGLAAGLLSVFGFCFGSAVLGFLFQFGLGLMTQLLAWDLILDLILMMPPSLSLELSMNSD